MENVTIINKENHFKVLYKEQKVELLGTTKEFKLEVYKDKRLLLSRSKGDLKYLKSLLEQGKADDIEKTNGRIKSIEIRVQNIKNEIGLIRNASVIDGHPLDFIIEIPELNVFNPIGKNTHIQSNQTQIQKEELKSSAELLQHIIDNDMEAFERKMYEVLINGDSEIVVPTLKEIVKEHGYKLIKSSK